MTGTILGFTPAVLAGVLAIVFAGGFVKGVAGFGYAIASTAILATILDPAVAVTIMIIPMMVGNLSLLTELDRSDVRPCVRRFWPYVAAAVVGTLLGMALLGRIPKSSLALGLGVFTFGYVLVTQPWVSLPGENRFADACFTEGTGAKVGLGLLSGVVFGASNIGVQVVAYLDHLDLDRSTFVGVLAMILVGIASVRIVAAYSLGLYGGASLLVVSVVAAVPGLLGVSAGGRLRGGIPESYQVTGTILLLTVIATRLTLGGLGLL